MPWWKKEKDLPAMTVGSEAAPTSADQVVASPKHDTADRRPIPAEVIAEIEQSVVPGRGDELVAVITRGYSTSYLSAEVFCLAAVIDVAGARLAAWPRFQRERALPRPYMWDEALYGAAPVDALVMPGLSHDARLVLAAQDSLGFTHRRSRGELSSKYLLTDGQIDRVQSELVEAGLAEWGVPTLRDAVDSLTVAELSPLFEPLPVKKSWTKARKLDVLFGEVDEADLRRFVLSMKPWAFDEVLSIRFVNDVDHGFHRAWARLVGHYIDLCSYRDRNFAQRQSSITAGWARSGPVHVLSDDECPTCHSAAGHAVSDDKSTWPPFHLGCRCTPLHGM